MGSHDRSRQGRVVFDTTWQAAIAHQNLADKAYAKILGPITIKRIMCTVTTAETVTDAIVAFDRRVLTGSDTGRVAVLDGTNGSLTIPVGAAVGKVYAKEVNVDCDAGDEIVLELTQASTAGGGWHNFEWVDRDELIGNQTDMVTSA